MRLFVFACRMRHVVLWAGHGRLGLVLLPGRHRSLAWPWRTGGTLAARLWWVLLVVRCW